MTRSLALLFSFVFLFTLAACPPANDDDSATTDDDDTVDDDDVVDDDDTADDDDSTATDDDDSTADDDDSTADDDDSTADDDDSTADDDDTVDDDDTADDDDTVTGATADPGDIVITEFLKNPNGTDDLREWFELYNSTSSDIDLENWTIHDLDFDSHVVVGSLLVPAEGYLVMGVTDVAADNGDIPVDYAYGQGEIILGNGGDELYIEDVAGTVIDSLEWNDADFPDTDGAAANLDLEALDATANDDGANWCDATDLAGSLGDHGTPGEANIDCDAVGDDDDSTSDDDDSTSDDDDSTADDDDIVFDDDDVVFDDDDSVIDDDDSVIDDDDSVSDDDDSVFDDDDSAAHDDDDSAFDDDDSAFDDDDSALDDDDSAFDDDDSASHDDDDSAFDDDDSAFDDDDSALDDDDSAFDDDDSAAADDDDSAVGPLISFASQVAPIVFNNCSCHQNPPGSGGWSHQNDPATLYAAWVNAPSTEVPMDRIEPGDYTTSYVLHKIAGTQAVGQRMPLGGPYLSDDDILLMGTWVDQGAMNN